jgi:hypothetical protein
LPLGGDPKTVVTGAGEWAGQVTRHAARRRFPSTVAVVVICGVCPVEVTGDRRPQQGPRYGNDCCKLARHATNAPMSGISACQRQNEQVADARDTAMDQMITTGLRAALACLDRTRAIPAQRGPSPGNSAGG